MIGDLTTDRELLSELRMSLRQLNAQIETVFNNARDRRADPYLLTTPDGAPVLTPLLTAKVAALRAIVDLRNTEKA